MDIKIPPETIIVKQTKDTENTKTSVFPLPGHIFTNGFFHLAKKRQASGENKKSKKLVLHFIYY